LADPSGSRTDFTKRKMLGLLGGGLLASCVKAPDSPALSTPSLIASLPFRFDYGRRLIVTGRGPGGDAFDFIFDTAATRTVLFENAAARAGAVLTDNKPAQVFGLSGVREAPVYDVGAFAFGDIPLDVNAVPILADWPESQRTPQGILGHDLFAAYGVVFHINERRVDIYDGPPLVDAGWRTAPLSQTTFGFAERPLFVVEVNFGAGRRVPFLLDTGGVVTACNFPTADYLQIVPPRARRPDRQPLADVHGEEVETYALTARMFEVGGIPYPLHTLAISDAEFFRQIGFAATPFGVLGLDTLQRRSFAIDFPNLRFLAPPPAA
jgi:hypothetical protein